MNSDSSSPHLSNGDLAAFLDGRLDAPARSAVEAHLADCARCREEMVETQMALSELGPSRRVPLARPNTFRRATWIAGVAAAILVIAMVPRLRQSSLAGRGDEARVRGGSASSSIIVVSPHADAADAGHLVFTWRSLEPDATYRLVVTDSVGAPVFRTTTRDTAVVLPAAIPVARGRSYFWYVDALRRGGHSVSTGVQSFSVPR
jgi:hypothetical protein